MNFPEAKSDVSDIENSGINLYNQLQQSILNICEDKTKSFIDASEFNTNIYNHQMTKGLKVSCQNIQHLLPKLDELKSNFSLMKDSEKPNVLGMCETYLNSQNVFKIQMN